MSEWRRRLYDSYVSSGQAIRVAAASDLESRYLDRVIRKHLQQDRTVTLLDLGCGNGRLLHALKKSGYKNCRGVDRSAEQVAVARSLGLNEAECGNLQEFLALQAAGSVDVIFLMDILEHLDKQEVFDLLDGCHRVLKQGGILLIHVPNASGVHGMEVLYGDFTHELAFTTRSLRQIFRCCGLRPSSFHEDTPVVHGIKSGIRWGLWHLLSLVPRLRLIAETGELRHVLTQNMLAVAIKDS